jgi:hypothetical protein
VDDGPIAPGRYLFTVGNSSDYEPDWAVAERPAAPLGVEVTVPMGGYTFSKGFPVIDAPGHNGAVGPFGGALVIGWPSYWVRLYSDPCFKVADEEGDIRVGPTVDDFVNAVAANPKLDITEPKDVELDGYPGKFFTLTLPSDISGCDSWQPWDPSFYAQGDNNLWDVWVIDADGFRVMIVNEYFPGTSQKLRADLRAMVDSITFD